MSAVSAPSTVHETSPASRMPLNGIRWIVSSWVDAVFIILTPLLATPAVLILYSSWVGVRAETISVIVAAFFATGHHLPGLIRAYGDRDLFARFRWRFLLAPPLVFLAYFPLYSYHFSLYRLMILSWATWHGLMQLYGFIRIYDSKVGSVARTTVYLDWMLCLCAFITPQLLRPEQLSNLLGHWYASGGAWLSASTLTAIRWSALTFSIAVLFGFAVNFGFQLFTGRKPSILKLFMLASGIGMWWYAMLGVDNLLIGVALFDICHDVQYLAIVWLINCRRVNASADLGRFMKFVFRRGMVLLYLGLITAYGALAFTGQLVLDGTIQRIFYGILFTSTILHYYYDGFIWKVREASNQASLDLRANGTSPSHRTVNVSGLTHFLKWSPLVSFLGLLFVSDLTSPSLTTAQQEQLNTRYSESLTGNPVLPPSEEERSWLYSQFERIKHVASSVPDDRAAQLRAAIMQANFGQLKESTQRLEELLIREPEYYGAWMSLGTIRLYMGEFAPAINSLHRAAACAKIPSERANALLKIGEACLYQGDIDSAAAHFKEARLLNPDAAEMIEEIRRRVQQQHKSSEP